MKIFHKDINEYEREPVIKEVRHVLQGDDFYEAEFIPIPGSKNEIMKDYLKVYRNVNFYNIPEDGLNCIHAHEVAKKISEATEENYRLPYLKEITDTFFKAKNSEFNSSVREHDEWLNEIINYMRHKKVVIIRDPTDVHTGGGQLRFSGRGENIKLAEESGVFGFTLNYGYPSQVSDKIILTDRPILWAPPVDPEGVYPVRRSWGRNVITDSDTMHVYLGPLKLQPTDNIAMRLVKVNQ